MTIAQRLKRAHAFLLAVYAAVLVALAFTFSRREAALELGLRTAREARGLAAAALECRRQAEFVRAWKIEGRLHKERARREDAVGRAQFWTRAASLSVGVCAAATLGLFAFWTAAFLAYLRRNFNRLEAAIAAIGGGDFRPLLASERPDELGRLSSALADMAQRLEETQKKLVETERQAAFGRLAMGAAHAMNNPLSTVIGLAELALDRGTLDAKDQGDVRTILEEAHRCDAALKNFEQFASPGAAAREPVELNEIASRLFRLIGPGFEAAGIALQLKLSDGHPSVLGVSRDLRHAVLNLLLNARQACRRGGVVSLETSVDGPDAVVTVADDGEGMSPETRARVFEPFFTTRPDRPGLGLTSAHAVVKAHGGRVEVDSAPGRGSRFELRLPAIVRADRPGTSSRGRILVVDDEPQVLSVVRRALKADGLEVDAVDSEAAALEAVGKREYAVVLSDYHLQGTDGRHLYEELRRLRPELALRFVLSTGEILSADLQSFAEKAGVRVILKPFDLRDLSRVVREVANT